VPGLQRTPENASFNRLAGHLGTGKILALQDHREVSTVARSSDGDARKACLLVQCAVSHLACLLSCRKHPPPGDRGCVVRAPPPAGRQSGTQRAHPGRGTAAGSSPGSGRAVASALSAPDHWACLRAADQARRLALDAAPPAAVARVFSTCRPPAHRQLRILVLLASRGGPANVALLCAHSKSQPRCRLAAGSRAGSRRARREVPLWQDLSSCPWHRNAATASAWESCKCTNPCYSRRRRRIQRGVAHLARHSPLGGSGHGEERVRAAVGTTSGAPS